MKESYGSLGVSLGEDAFFLCHTYPHKPEAGPIVSINTPGLSVSLSNGARGAVEASDVENARRLLEVVSKFTAEVERLYAVNNPPAENTAA
ncbi:hypothetical protein [Actinomadura sp. 3N407]|uniref:hypothetical protein n=1 Tax=Actinomadura sp. 3N407 TaxID=3457423 RepID=UPI003FCC30A5